MNKKGSMLILTIFVVVILLILGAALIARSISEHNLAKKYLESTHAFWAAEAGANRALKELRSNYNQSGTGLWLSSMGEGEYSVDVVIEGQNRRVTAHGFIPSMSGARTQRSIEVLIKSQYASAFRYAAFANNSVTLNSNAKTDSYDSSLGAYDPNNPNHNGDVGTNGTSVVLDSNAQIDGDTGTGPGGSVTLESNAVVTGQITNDINRELSSVEVPSSLVNLGSGGNYSENSGSHTISSGDYQYNSFTLDSNAEVIIDGQVNLYLTAADISFNLESNSEIKLNPGAKLIIYVDGKYGVNSNAKVNAGGLPTNVIVYSTYSGSGDGVGLDSNGDFNGAIYAPDARISLNSNAKVYGSVVGKTVDIDSNAKIHYDENLVNVESGLIRYVVQSWKEQVNPYQLTP